MVPEELKSRTQWLVWRFEKNPKKPEGKQLKVPYYADGTRRTGPQGSPEDRQKLTTFDYALEQMTRRGMTGVGFAFLKGDGLIGIDLDKVIDGDGVIADRAIEIVRACDSFTEYSVSRRGLHVYVLGETTTFKSDAIGVEVFCGGQYFAFTGERFPETSDTVKPIPAETLARLRSLVDKAKERARSRRAVEKGPGQSAPAGEPGGKGAAKVRSLDNDFKRVNDAAIQHLAAWVPALLPAARAYKGGFRVASADLGRDLEEDLSILPEGIVDWGLNDQGDPQEGRRTPIDLVIEHGSAKKPAEALHWLAERLGIALSKPRRGRGGGGSGAEPPPAPPEDDPPDDPGLPLIKWVQGQLPRVVDEAELALDASVRFFQRGNHLVRVVRRDKPTNRDYDQPLGVLGLHAVDKGWLVEAMTRAAIWKKYDARRAAWVRINAPEQAASTYLARVGHWRVPPLWSVITAPTLRPDGSVLQKPGYDAAKQCWYDPCGVQFPEIPAAPSKDDAKYALEKLVEAFGTLPFESKVDRSVVLSLVLGTLVRRSLPTAPMVGISAPDGGTGKTLIADAAAIIATGSPAAAMKYPETDEEAAKRALAILAEGDLVILIDNVERPLQGDWLCTILTSEHYQDRVLGKTEMLTVPTTSQWLATGNNLVLAGDLRLRTLLCRLDAKCERPDLRVFAEDLRVQLLRDRPALVAAGLTVIRAFLHAKVRAAELVPTWGRFERWSEWARAPLVWLGEEDPCKSRTAIEGNDPHRDALLRMHAAWRALFADDEKTTREVVESCQAGLMLSTEQKALREVLRDVARDRKTGEPDTMRLAHWLGKHIGRRLLGCHFERSGERDHVSLYRLVKDPNFKEAPAG